MIYVLVKIDDESQEIIGYNSNKDVLIDYRENLNKDAVIRNNLIYKFKKTYQYNPTTILPPIKIKGIKIPERGNTSPEHYKKICKLINDENALLNKKRQNIMDEHRKQCQLRDNQTKEFNEQFIKNHSEFTPLYDKQNKCFHIYHAHTDTYDIQEIQEIKEQPHGGIS